MLVLGLNHAAGRAPGAIKGRSEVVHPVVSTIARRASNSHGCQATAIDTSSHQRIASGRSEQLSELLRVQTGISGDGPHRDGVDRIVPGNHEASFAIA